jgi:putative membrane protein
MKKLLAALALIAPLAGAPWAVGADAAFDASFYKNAAEGGLYEVDVGKQAEEKASSQQVKDFGAMMVKDHTAAGAKLQSIAASKNISLPTSPSMGEMASKAKLDVLSGATYDKAYMQSQIKAHQETIALFKKEIAEGRDADAKAFATAALPTLQHHLAVAQQIAAAGGYSS